MDVELYESIVNLKLFSVVDSGYMSLFENRIQKVYG